MELEWNPPNPAVAPVPLTAVPEGQSKGAHSSQVHPNSARHFLGEHLVSWRQLSHCWGASGEGNVLQ